MPFFSRRGRSARGRDLPPTLGTVLFHGTSTQRAARGIRREGIKPPNLRGRRGSDLCPVPGQVYLTPDIEYATIYALGGVWMGGAFPESDIRGEEFGYVFVVRRHALREVHPDEDSIGEMIASEEPAWLRKKAVWRLQGDEYEAYEDEWMPVLDAADEGLYDAYALAGKAVLPHLSAEEEIELINRGAHIAHTGTVRPSQCWRIKKVDSIKLEKDASNFFQIAKRCIRP